MVQSQANIFDNEKNEELLACSHNRNFATKSCIYNQLNQNQDTSGLILDIKNKYSTTTKSSIISASSSALNEDEILDSHFTSFLLDTFKVNYNEELANNNTLNK